VIIPAYNAAGFIVETLGSALNQTYRDLEIIVVDDGSTDNTAEIVEDIASRDTRVCLLRQKNRGAAAARNLGIEHAGGRLIAPLDADDLWRPDKIAKQVTAMRSAGPRVGMVYAWSSLIDEAGRALLRGGNVARYEGYVQPFLVLHNFIGNGSAPLLRRECVLEVGGYDTSLRPRGGECEDHMLYLDIAERYDVVFVPEILVGYRVSPSSLSNNVQRMKRGHELVLETMRSTHAELPNRLYRWSRSFNCVYLGRRCLRRGKPLAAAWLFISALAHDPAMVWEPAFRRAIGRLVAQFAASMAKSEAEPGCRFLDRQIQLATLTTGETKTLSRRRHSFLVALAKSARHREPLRRPKSSVVNLAGPTTLASRGSTASD
jgi:glycosyltransferase involved in cell wall biosynthesis